MAKVT